MLSPFTGEVPEGSYISNAILVDIDPGKEAALEKLTRMVPITITVNDVQTDTDWKRQDRQFFEKNPRKKYTARKTTKEEREQARKYALAANLNLYELMEGEKPFFDQVLVTNICPGLRMRINVDDPKKTPDGAFILVGMPPSGLPYLQPVSEIIDTLKAAWKQSTKEDNNATSS